MNDVHNFINNKLSTQYQLEATTCIVNSTVLSFNVSPPLSFNLDQIPLKLKFRCYNPVTMHNKTSSELFKKSNEEIQETCNEHAQLYENYHSDECPKSHFGGAIFLTIVLTGTVSTKNNKRFNSYTKT